MKFTQLRPAAGDCTAPYSVTNYKAKKVGELIQEILKEKPKEWGYIGIKDGCSIFGNPECEYRYGKLLNTMPGDILEAEIEKVSSSGGWSRMDYLITIKK